MTFRCMSRSVHNLLVHFLAVEIVRQNAIKLKRFKHVSLCVAAGRLTSCSDSQSCNTWQNVASFTTVAHSYSLPSTEMEILLC